MAYGKTMTMMTPYGVIGWEIVRVHAYQLGSWFYIVTVLTLYSP